MFSSARRAALAAAGLAVLALPAPPAASAAAFCSFDFPVTIAPGLSMTPSAATFTTGGRTGNIACNGDVYGKTITGPGIIANGGHFAAPSSCADGSGAGTATFRLATADGPVELRNRFTFSYVAGLGSFTGTVISGGFGFLPTKGDCLTAPLTESRVSGFGQLTA